MTRLLLTLAALTDRALTWLADGCWRDTEPASDYGDGDE